MGYDVARVGNVDPRMTDDKILEWALEEHRIIVTTDKDFEEMVWRREYPHGGILRLENLPRFERKSLLKDMLRKHRQDLDSGAIVIAQKKKFRIRRR